MPTAAQNLAFIHAGLLELVTYLNSDVLFWPLAGSSNQQRLTPGGILLGVKRLWGWEISLAGQMELTRLENQLDSIRRKWSSAWELKSRQEVHVRLNLWKNYLADYRESPDLQAELYPQQVHLRVLIHLLELDTGLLPEETEILAELDRIIQSAWLSGGFLWEQELASTFPEPEYWFLYGILKS
jgi:hypothetical protein